MYPRLSYRKRMGGPPNEGMKWEAASTASFLDFHAGAVS